MSANDLLTLTTQVCFILLGVMTAADYVYHRDIMRRDIALMFWSLAFPLLVQLTVRIIAGTIPIWLRTFDSFLIIAQPYLLLRLVRYLRPIPLRMNTVAFIGMAASWIAVLVFPTPLPRPVTLLIIAYFVLVDGYAMLAFVRGALRTTGVTRQRLRFAAGGSGLLAMALLMAGIAAVPGLQGITSLIQIAAVASVVMYYIGFAPPRWLRRTWQFTELNNYLFQISNAPVNERLDITKSMTELCYVANRAVGGLGAGIITKDQNQWTLRYKIGEVELLEHPDTFNRIWEKGVPGSIHDTLLAVPVGQRSPVLLLVYLRYGSLFIEDDLNLVALLTKQSAVFLENAELVQQMRQTLELTETLYDTSQQLLSAKGYEQSLNVVFRYAQKSGASRVALFSIDADGEGKPEWITNIGTITDGSEIGPPPGLRYSTTYIPFAQYWMNAPNDVLMVEDTMTDPRFDENSRHISRQNHIHAIVLMPLTINGVWLGLLTMNWKAPHRFGEFDRQFYSALASLFATVLETERLRMAEQEALNRLASTNKELETFSYSVSHDLRTPLRSLDGFSQLLLEDYSDLLDDEGRNYLGRIRLASQRMGELIDDILNLSRPD